MLTPEQIKQFDDNGFLILPNFFDISFCDTLMSKAKELINAFEPSDNKTIFSAKNQQHAKYRYFLESSDSIHFFFEEDAFDEHGMLTQPKEKAINKIGHALHDVDPVFNLFSRQAKIAALVDALTITQPLIAQSMYICKQPYIGGEVTCHQDATYLYVENKPVIGLWFALEDATIENGCLWGIPGGHKDGLKSRSIRDQNDVVSVDVYDHTPWSLEQMVPLEVARGSVILLHGLLPHMSKANTSPKSRHAYTLHIISGDHHYPANNWLQRPANNPFKGFV